MRSISGLSCLLLLIPATQLTQSQSSPAQNPSDAKAAPTVYSQVPQANALYIQGLDYLSKGNPRDGGTLANARQAVRLFSQAVKKDPKFALAYLGLADAWGCFRISVPGSAGVNPYPHQLAAALKAEKLDDSLPKVHSLLASLYFNTAYDWESAEREYKRVISMTNNMASHSQYAIFLATQGRFEEAIAEVKLAEKIDPSSPATNLDMLQIYYWRHEDDQALEQGREMLRKDPPHAYLAHFFMGFAYIHKGEFENAIREFKLSTVLGDAGSLSALGYAYAMSGDKAETQNVLLRLKHHGGAKNVSYRVAAIYLALGDRDRAIKLIEKDYRGRSNWLNRLNVDPVMDPLRDDPRFKDLMRKMNFQRDARQALQN
jgi:tetratricopeptide (TPR) repeat protein